jgi:hypothetical protein
MPPTTRSVTASNSGDLINLPDYREIPENKGTGQRGCELLPLEQGYSNDAQVELSIDSGFFDVKIVAGPRVTIDFTHMQVGVVFLVLYFSDRKGERNEVRYALAGQLHPVTIASFLNGIGAEADQNPILPLEAWHLKVFPMNEFPRQDLFNALTIGKDLIVHPRKYALKVLVWPPPVEILAQATLAHKNRVARESQKKRKAQAAAEKNIGAANHNKNKRKSNSGNSRAAEDFALQILQGPVDKGINSQKPSPMAFLDEMKNGFDTRGGFAPSSFGPSAAVDLNGNDAAVNAFVLTKIVGSFVSVRPDTFGSDASPVNPSDVRLDQQVVLVTDFLPEDRTVKVRVFTNEKEFVHLLDCSDKDELLLYQTNLCVRLQEDEDQGRRALQKLYDTSLIFTVPLQSIVMTKQLQVKTSMTWRLWMESDNCYHEYFCLWGIASLENRSLHPDLSTADLIDINKGMFIERNWSLETQLQFLRYTADVNAAGFAHAVNEHQNVLHEKLRNFFTKGKNAKMEVKDTRISMEEVLLSFPEDLLSGTKCVLGPIKPKILAQDIYVLGQTQDFTILSDMLRGSTDKQGNIGFSSKDPNEEQLRFIASTLVLCGKEFEDVQVVFRSKAGVCGFTWCFPQVQLFGPWILNDGWGGNVQDTRVDKWNGTRRHRYFTILD